MQFKTGRIESEWRSGLIHPRLKTMVKQLDSKFPIFITGIFRTQKEQDAIYGDDPKYKENPWHSVHQDWRGIDLRKYDSSQELIDWVNQNYVYDSKRAELKCGIIHEYINPVTKESNGWHVHLQVM